MMQKAFIAFLFIAFYTKGFAQFTFEERYDGISKLKQQEIASIHELIVLDLDSAMRKIEALKKDANESTSSNLNIDVLSLEAELYRSMGDYVHMKLALYQALSWKNEQTGLYQKLLLDHLYAINEGVKGNGKKQEKLLEHVIKECKEHQFYFLEAKALYSLAKFYKNEENFRKAHIYFSQASELFIKHNYNSLNYETDVSQAICYYSEQKYDKALQYFHKAKAFAEKQKLGKCYPNALINLAEAHLFIPGNKDSAAFYFSSFLSVKERADIRDLYNCYWNLEEYYLQVGKQDSAYYYLRLAYETDNQIRDGLKDRNRAEIDDLYKKLQNQRKLEDEKNYQELLKIIFALCGVFLLLVISVFWFVLKEKSKINKQLTLQNDEILLKNALIDQTLNEKELLLKEVHHRVKNNLQIISSLLNLQIKNSSDEHLHQSLIEAKERIQAIALIHKKLYLDKSFASIQMDEYLEELLIQLKQTYASKNANIDIQFKANRIVLNLDTVVPLGLIICELTTNAFKYAFQDRTQGRLKIEIKHGENNSFVLHVKDDGKGMEKEFNFLESSTLGVEIVTALVDQLDGTIGYRSDENGTTITIKFKEINGN